VWGVGVRLSSHSLQPDTLLSAIPLYSQRLGAVHRRLLHHSLDVGAQRRGSVLLCRRHLVLLLRRVAIVGLMAPLVVSLLGLGQGLQFGRGPPLRPLLHWLGCQRRQFRRNARRGRRGGRNVEEVAAVASSRKDVTADVAATPTARRSASAETKEVATATAMAADLTAIGVAEAATADVAATATEAMDV